METDLAKEISLLVRHAQQAMRQPPLIVNSTVNTRKYRRRETVEELLEAQFSEPSVQRLHQEVQL
jgi:hypothetical protein